MNENLAKKKKKFLTKKIRKILLIVVVILLTGAFFYILPFTNELKETLFNNTSSEPFEESSNEHAENGENETDENFLPQLDESGNNTVKQPNLPAIKPSQIEINCKKYAFFISNFIMLQEKIMTGKGFSKEISELSNLNMTDNEIKNKIHQLSLFAEVGVPTFLDLRDEFFSMADEIIRAYQLENEPNKLRKKAIKFFQELIFIKKVGERAIKKGGIEGIVQNIKNFLENEEIPEALLEAEKITNNKVKDMVGSWIQDFRNYLKLQELYEDFKKQVLEKTNCSSFVND